MFFLILSDVASSLACVYAMRAPSTTPLFLSPRIQLFDHKSGTPSLLPSVSYLLLIGSTVALLLFTVVEVH